MLLLIGSWYGIDGGYFELYWVVKDLIFYYYDVDFYDLGLYVVIVDLLKVNWGFGLLLLLWIVVSVFVNELCCWWIMFDFDYCNIVICWLCEWVGCKFFGEYDMINWCMVFYVLEVLIMVV